MTLTTTKRTTSSRPTLLVPSRRLVLPPPAPGAECCGSCCSSPPSSTAGAFGGDYNFTFSTPGSDSQKAQDLLESGFPTAGRRRHRRRPPDPAGKTVDDPAVQAAIVDILDQFGNQPHVSSVVSPFSPEGARRSRRSARSRTAPFDSTRRCPTTRPRTRRHYRAGQEGRSSGPAGRAGGLRARRRGSRPSSAPRASASWSRR